MKKTATFAAILAVTLIGSTFSQAQNEKPNQIQKRFQELDADNNGSISYEEFLDKAKYPRRAPKIFHRMDTDKSDSISFEEFSAAKRKAAKGGQSESEASDSEEGTGQAESTGNDEVTSDTGADGTTEKTGAEGSAEEEDAAE